MPAGHSRQLATQTANLTQHKPINQTIDSPNRLQDKQISRIKPVTPPNHHRQTAARESALSISRQRRVTLRPADAGLSDEDAHRRNDRGSEHEKSQSRH